MQATKAVLAELQPHRDNNQHTPDGEDNTGEGVLTKWWRQSRRRELLFGGQGERDGCRLTLSDIMNDGENSRKW
jgi:hypothetical protein